MLDSDTIGLAGLTFSHDSVAGPARRNQTSAKAGCFPGFFHIKVRLFSDQDMEIFCGASNLTVEEKQRKCVWGFSPPPLLMLLITSQNSGSHLPNILQKESLFKIYSYVLVEWWHPKHLGGFFFPAISWGLAWTELAHALNRQWTMSFITETTCANNCAGKKLKNKNLGRSWWMRPHCFDRPYCRI